MFNPGKRKPALVVYLIISFFKVGTTLVGQLFNELTLHLSNVKQIKRQLMHLCHELILYLQIETDDDRKTLAQAISTDLALGISNSFFLS